MARRARAVHLVRDTSAEQKAIAAAALLHIGGGTISALGVVIAAGGLSAPFAGSPFHVLADCGLIASGVLMAQGRRAGAILYMLVFATTLAWSLRNVQVGGSSLAMRLTGPAILLFIIALVMPVLRGWQPLRAAAAFAIILSATIGIGVASRANGPLAGQAAALSQYLDTQGKGGPQ